MKKTFCFCDRCGKEITDVIYTLTCYADDVINGIGIFSKAGEQNLRQNMVKAQGMEKELCQECKDALTDGLFIV